MIKKLFRKQVYMKKTTWEADSTGETVKKFHLGFKKNFFFFLTDEELYLGSDY